MVTKWSSSSCDDFENIIFTGTIIQNLYILASYRYLTNNQTKNLGKIELLCSWEVGNLAESRNIIRMWKSLFWQTYRMLIQQWTLARIKIISEFNWFKCWYVQIWHCSSLHGPHICRDRWVHFSWCLVLQCTVCSWECIDSTMYIFTFVSTKWCVAMIRYAQPLAVLHSLCWSLLCHRWQRSPASRGCEGMLLMIIFTYYSSLPHWLRRSVVSFCCHCLQRSPTCWRCQGRLL